MNCIICGRKAEMTKLLDDIEAAFCYSHLPEGIGHNGALAPGHSLQVIVKQRIIVEEVIFTEVSV